MSVSCYVTEKYIIIKNSQYPFVNAISTRKNCRISINLAKTLYTKQQTIHKRKSDCNEHSNMTYCITEYCPITLWFMIGLHRHSRYFDNFLVCEHAYPIVCKDRGRAYMAVSAFKMATFTLTILLRIYANMCVCFFDLGWRRSLEKTSVLIST